MTSAKYPRLASMGTSYSIFTEGGSPALIPRALRLRRNALFVAGGAFEQEFIRVEDAVTAQLAGHNGLGFVLQQVRLGADIHHRDARGGGIGGGGVQRRSQASGGCDGIVVVGDIGHGERDRQDR